MLVAEGKVDKVDGGHEEGAHHVGVVEEQALREVANVTD